MIHVQRNRSEKVFLCNFRIIHRFLKSLFYPNGWLRNITANSRCNMTERLRKLLFGPHVSVSEEKFSPNKSSFRLFDLNLAQTRCSLFTEGLLCGHWQECSVLALSLCLINISFHFEEFFMRKKVFIRSDPYRIIVRIASFRNVSFK
jgi:hypothetical protein